MDFLPCRWTRPKLLSIAVYPRTDLTSSWDAQMSHKRWMLKGAFVPVEMRFVSMTYQHEESREVGTWSIAIWANTPKFLFLYGWHLPPDPPKFLQQWANTIAQANSNYISCLSMCDFRQTCVATPSLCLFLPNNKYLSSKFITLSNVRGSGTDL